MTDQRRLPDEIHGVYWVDGDSGSEYWEYDAVESRPDPSDVERAVYVRKDLMPVTPSIPITVLREWIGQQDWTLTIGALEVLLDAHEKENPDA